MKTKLILFASILSLTLGAAPNSFGQWVQTTLNAPDVYCFAAIGTNLYVGTGNGVFFTTNNGMNWKGASSGLPPNTNVTALLVSDANLFAVANGVYLLKTTPIGGFR